MAKKKKTVKTKKSVKKVQTNKEVIAEFMASIVNLINAVNTLNINLEHMFVENVEIGGSVTMAETKNPATTQNQ